MFFFRQNLDTADAVLIGFTNPRRTFLAAVGLNMLASAVCGVAKSGFGIFGLWLSSIFVYLDWGNASGLLPVIGIGSIASFGLFTYLLMSERIRPWISVYGIFLSACVFYSRFVFEGERWFLSLAIFAVLSIYHWIVIPLIVRIITSSYFRYEDFLEHFRYLEFEDPDEDVENPQPRSSSPS